MKWRKCRMKIITYYEALDRKIFYDKQSCEEYEAFLKKQFPAKFFSGSGAWEEVSSIKEAGFLVIYRRDFLDLVEDEKERKNLETLERLAKSFADKMTITSKNMPAEMQKQVWNTNYNYYFNKYKNIYS